MIPRFQGSLPIDEVSPDPSYQPEHPASPPPPPPQPDLRSLHPIDFVAVHPRPHSTQPLQSSINLVSVPAPIAQSASSIPQTAPYNIQTAYNSSEVSWSSHSNIPYAIPAPPLNQIPLGYVQPITYQTQQQQQQQHQQQQPQQLLVQPVYQYLYPQSEQISYYNAVPDQDIESKSQSSRNNYPMASYYQVVPTTTYYSQYPQLQQQVTSSPYFAPAQPSESPTSKPKRTRRKRHEVERLYFCNFEDCNKGYGSLSHLNGHIVKHGHGKRRHPEEFTGLRKFLKEREKDKDHE